MAVYSVKVEELLVAEVGFGDWELILELKLLKEGIKIVLVDGSGDTHFSEDKTQKLLDIKVGESLSIMLAEHGKNSVDRDLQVVWETHFLI